ncbi:hypothetical protein RB653_000599 [Dictyostelium firmibasis]|uniref:Beta-galactosidase n=1 Tax=Dictyostelium firmibasis TaxID=79012 RepID=A0AAN7YQS1_9MYCE
MMGIKNNFQLLWLISTILLLFIIVLVNGISIANLKNNEIKFHKSQNEIKNNKLNVTYDGRSLIINGERKLLISGSVHYPRTSEEMWPIILKQSKDAGIDMIETYIFWNIHQPNSPSEYYFEGNANITKFLDLCQEYGLLVNLRIGPYVCAEWTYGGFPIWLKEIPNIIYRDYNQQWMNEMSIWMEFVVKYLGDYFAPNGGPIVLAQVENEYGWLEEEYGINGSEYAKWSIDFALNLNIGIPWIMCQQNNIENAIDTCNGYYCHDWIQGHWEQFPDQPSFWTENWIGWFENWGQAKPKRPVQDMLFSNARFIAYGGSLINYYMWFGGTNFGRTSGGPWIITSYDYDAPLDEFGQPNEPKFSLSSKFHQVLHSIEQDLLNNPPPKSPIFLSQVTEVHQYGSNLSFITNYGTGPSADIVQWMNQTITIQPWSVLIIYNNQILFDTSFIPPNTLFNNNTINNFKPIKNIIQSIVEISDFNLNINNYNNDYYSESSSSDNNVISISPIEQLFITKDTSDYCWYITNVTTTSSSYNDKGNLFLTISEFYDYVHVFIDNDYQGSASSPSLCQLQLKPKDNSTTFQLQILSMTIGLENYAAHMENYTRGILGSVLVGSQNITNNQWLMKSGLVGENVKIYNNNDENNNNWIKTSESSSSSSSSTLIQTPLTWYKLNISLNGLPNDIGSTVYALNMSSMNKGMIWVNGYSIGRYWLIEATQSVCNESIVTNYIGEYDPSDYRIDCNQPSQSIYSVPIDWLFNNDYSNQYATIIIIEELNGDPNQIQLLSNKIIN